MPIAALYPVTGHPLLGEKFAKLKTDEERDAYVILSELLLDLRAPAYTGQDAEELTYANVMQVNFQLEHGLTPEITKSVSQSHPGNTTTYRDRYVSPAAWAIVQRVTKVQNVAFRPPGIGV